MIESPWFRDHAVSQRAASRRRWRTALCQLALSIATACGVWAAPSGPAPIGGAVASAAPAATEAGLAVLRAGGNAADGAVATALALAVVHPVAGNLGGGGFAVVRFGASVAALDFRESAPGAATASMYLDPNGRPIPERSLVGPLAAGVPGSPVGLYELHRRFGRLPWRGVVAPAIRLAADGFVVNGRLHREIEDEKVLLARFPTTAAVWLPGGRPPDEGWVVRLPKLAATLRAYAAKGPQALTGGAAAHAIVVAAARDGGILTLADLSGYRAVWREPVRFAAFGWQVAAMPLPSSGGIILAESCGMLDRLRWSSLPRGGVERAHLLAETFRRAFADRFLLGDPATALAGPAQLLDPDWLATRAAGIDRGRASPSDEVHPWPGAPATEKRQTTHLSVMDGDGNAVSLTTTLNGAFGCGLLVPELGILLNNEMDDFAAAPGRPNLYGLIQGEANAIAPGKRMLSSMCPVVAWCGYETLVLGSPGGSHIPTAVAQVLLGVLVDRDSLQAAVARPRIHHQWLPDELAVEPGALDAGAAAELRRRGHYLRETPRLGEVNAVARRTDGLCEAVADPRGPGAAGTVTAKARPGTR
ncbi:MAG: gamma-glutamyltransferase [Thermoanaerobaculales bacterium]